MLLMNRFPMTPTYSQMRDEVNQLFNSAFLNMPAASFGATSVGGPAMNVWETEKNYSIEAELPGYAMSDLDITVLDSQVTIKGTRTITAPDGATYLRRERPTGTFTRTWNLPNAVEAEKVEASLTNGVLTVTLPKTAKVQPKRITVKTA